MSAPLITLLAITMLGAVYVTLLIVTHEIKQHTSLPS